MQEDYLAGSARAQECIIAAIDAHPVAEYVDSL
jgi:hypothetical protein